jgi:hypothetical protein
LPAAELDARLDHQRTIDPDEWSLAERREAAIREARRSHRTPLPGAPSHPDGGSLSKREATL